MEEKVKDIISDEQQEYVINMGPQHPSTHGVLRLVVSLKGEVVKNIEPHIGYIHRGIEKMCESLTYPQIIHLTDRMDYLSAHINNIILLLLSASIFYLFFHRLRGNIIIINIVFS